MMPSVAAAHAFLHSGFGPGGMDRTLTHGRRACVVEVRDRPRGAGVRQEMWPDQRGVSLQDAERRACAHRRLSAARLWQIEKMPGFYGSPGVPIRGVGRRRAAGSRR